MWILLLFLIGREPKVYSVEFLTEETCIKAAKMILNSKHIKGEVRLLASCVKK